MVQYLSHKFELATRAICLAGCGTPNNISSEWSEQRLLRRPYGFRVEQQFWILVVEWVRSCEQPTNLPRGLFWDALSIVVCTTFAPLSFTRRYRISSEYSGVSIACSSAELLYLLASQNCRFLHLFFCYLWERCMQDYVKRSTWNI